MVRGFRATFKYKSWEGEREPAERYSGRQGSVLLTVRDTHLIFVSFWFFSHLSKGLPFVLPAYGSHILRPPCFRAFWVVRWSCPYAMSIYPACPSLLVYLTCVSWWSSPTPPFPFFLLFLKNTHSVVNNNGWAEGFLSSPDCITISSREGCGSLFMNRAGPKEEDEEGETS